MIVRVAILLLVSWLIGALIAAEYLLGRETSTWVLFLTLCLLMWFLWELVYWPLVAAYRGLRWLVWDVRRARSDARTTPDRTGH